MPDHKIAQPVGHYVEIIPPDLLDLMVKELDNISPEVYSEARIGTLDDSVFNLETRNSRISWWYEEHWVSSIFSHYFNKVNRDFWEYDLNHLEGIQISTYEEGDHYTWHSDYGTSGDSRYTRKLSASLLITDPSEYEGGDLEFIDYHGNTIAAPKGKGTMIIFDSRIPHRVTPITKGKRVSLVAWMLGPKLK
jgi:PKHD-type hydroxylase